MKIGGFILPLFVLAAHPVAGAETRPPLVRELIGLNGHTVQFKPQLYAPVAKLVRDYHPLKWDVGDDTSFVTTFPLARNGVDWSEVYGSWRKAGWRIDVSLMFDDIARGDWKDISRDAAAYGEAFARHFGPSGAALVESIEIGNEPGKYSDAEYRQLFEAMARGLRKGDPQLRIATCAANLGPSGRYSKSVDCLTGLESLFDVVSIHIYAEIEGWPTWRRSYAEDPKILFRTHLRSVLTWRAEHAPDKEVWLTEFGWDASTKPAPSTGDFAKWQGNTETQQAQWIVRAWLLLAREGVDRAYLYFFNDDDAPHVHGSSGLTRNFQPKPAYYAASWLQRNLGEYRFARILLEDDAAGYVYEFAHESDPHQRIVALWKPSGADGIITVPLGSAKIIRAERMPLGPGAAESVEASANNGMMRTTAGESPVFVWLRDEP